MPTHQPEGPLTAHRITEPDVFPEPYPWCLACGFQHEADEHCPECNGDHSQGFCMAPELADELARVDARLRRRVEEASAELYAQVVTVLCAKGGERWLAVGSVRASPPLSWRPATRSAGVGSRQLMSS